MTRLPRSDRDGCIHGVTTEGILVKHSRPWQDIPLSQNQMFSASYWPPDQQWIAEIQGHPSTARTWGPGDLWHSPARKILARKIVARHGTENLGMEKYWHGVAETIAINYFYLGAAGPSPPAAPRGLPGPQTRWRGARSLVMSCHVVATLISHSVYTQSLGAKKLIRVDFSLTYIVALGIFLLSCISIFQKPLMASGEGSIALKNIFGVCLADFNLDRGCSGGYGLG